MAGKSRFSLPEGINLDMFSIAMVFFYMFTRVNFDFQKAIENMAIDISFSHEKKVDFP